MQFRKEIEEELGVELPPIGQPMPPEAEKRLSEMMAKAAVRVTDKALVQADQERIKQEMQDPLLQMKEREVAVKEAEVQRKAIQDANRVSLAQTKENNSVAIKQEEIATEKELKGLEIGQQIASDLLDQQREDSKIARDDYQKGLDMAKEFVDNLDQDG